MWKSVVEVVGKQAKTPRPTLLSLLEQSQSSPIHLKNVYTLLNSKEQYQRLFEEYNSGELSVEDAAHRMGFSLPNEEIGDFISKVVDESKK
eukprot:m.27831 g.27831  ORF g.27831 m.27831 type:complete len:91 (-) comp9402_c1_seq1:521-793(-)